MSGQNNMSEHIRHSYDFIESNKKLGISVAESAELDLINEVECQGIKQVVNFLVSGNDFDLNLYNEGVLKEIRFNQILIHKDFVDPRLCNYVSAFSLSPLESNVPYNKAEYGVWLGLKNVEGRQSQIHHLCRICFESLPYVIHCAQEPNFIYEMSDWQISKYLDSLIER
jgi:hypothetical protein